MDSLKAKWIGNVFYIVRSINTLLEIKYLFKKNSMNCNICLLTDEENHDECENYIEGKPFKGYKDRNNFLAGLSGIDVISHKIEEKK